MNTKLRKKEKSYSEKDVFKLNNNAVFGKTMETVKMWKKKIEVSNL